MTNNFIRIAVLFGLLMPLSLGCSNLRPGAKDAQGKPQYDPDKDPYKGKNQPPPPPPPPPGKDPNLPLTPEEKKEKTLNAIKAGVLDSNSLRGVDSSPEAYEELLSLNVNGKNLLHAQSDIHAQAQILKMLKGISKDARDKIFFQTASGIKAFDNFASLIANTKDVSALPATNAKEFIDLLDPEGLNRLQDANLKALSKNYLSRILDSLKVNDADSQALVLKLQDELLEEAHIPANALKAFDGKGLAKLDEELLIKMAENQAFFKVLGMDNLLSLKKETIKKLVEPRVEEIFKTFDKDEIQRLIKDAKGTQIYTLLISKKPYDILDWPRADLKALPKSFLSALAKMLPEKFIDAYGLDFSSLDADTQKILQPHKTAKASSGMSSAREGSAAQRQAYKDSLKHLTEQEFMKVATENPHHIVELYTPKELSDAVLNMVLQKFPNYLKQFNDNDLKKINFDTLLPIADQAIQLLSKQYLLALGDNLSVFIRKLSDYNIHALIEILGNDILKIKPEALLSIAIRNPTAVNPILKANLKSLDQKILLHLIIKEHVAIKDLNDPSLLEAMSEDAQVDLAKKQSYILTDKKYLPYLKTAALKELAQKEPKSLMSELLEDPIRKSLKEKHGQNWLKDLFGDLNDMQQRFDSSDLPYLLEELGSTDILKLQFNTLNNLASNKSTAPMLAEKLGTKGFLELRKTHKDMATTLLKNATQELSDLFIKKMDDFFKLDEKQQKRLIDINFDKFISSVSVEDLLAMPESLLLHLSDQHANKLLKKLQARILDLPDAAKLKLIEKEGLWIIDSLTVEQLLELSIPHLIALIDKHSAYFKIKFIKDENRLPTAVLLHWALKDNFVTDRMGKKILDLDESTQLQLAKNGADSFGYGLTPAEWLILKPAAAKEMIKHRLNFLIYSFKNREDKKALANSPFLDWMIEAAQNIKDEQLVKDFVQFRIDYRN